MECWSCFFKKKCGKDSLRGRLRRRGESKCVSEGDGILLPFACSSFPFPFPTVACRSGYGKGNIQEDANKLDQLNASPYKN